jgi:hypothetical protein
MFHKYYTNKDKKSIVSVRFGNSGWYRAFTSDFDFHQKHITALAWQRTKVAAQRDLDALAETNNLVKAP